MPGVTIQRIAWFVLTLIHWIAIYPLDSVILPSNNWGLDYTMRGLCLVSKATVPLPACHHKETWIPAVSCKARYLGLAHWAELYRETTGQGTLTQEQSKAMIAKWRNQRPYAWVASCHLCQTKQVQYKCNASATLDRVGGIHFYFR